VPGPSSPCRRTDAASSLQRARLGAEPRGVVGGSWNGDGTMMLAGGSLGGIPGALVRLPEAGGVPSAVAIADAKIGEIILRHPQGLPDGSTLCTIIKDRRSSFMSLPGPVR
jgi:hypothetical protein